MGQVLLDSKLINRIYGIYEKKHRAGGVDPYGYPYPRSPKVTKSEIKQILTCRANEDYTPMYCTDLYLNRSGAYTKLLFVIECLLNGGDIVLSSKTLEVLK